MNDQDGTDEDSRRDREIRMKFAELDHNVAQSRKKAHTATTAY
jgi:hypothetical protein